MKTITMKVGAAGQVETDEKKLGRVGEHKNTRLQVAVDTAFAADIDYFRMSFGGFETAELQPTDGILAYDVPAAATGSTVKSWQLTGYKAGAAEPELVRKSQMIIFILEPSVTGEELLHEQYGDSIECDILRAKAALAEAESVSEKFVLREDGKGLSTHDYTDADKAAVYAADKYLTALNEGKTILEAENAVITGGIVYDLADGIGKYVGDIHASGGIDFTVQSPAAGIGTVDIYFVSYEDRALRVSVGGSAVSTLNCPGNWSDWDQTVAKVSVEVPLQAGANTLRLDNPDGYTPNIERIEVRLPEPIHSCFQGMITTSSQLDAATSDGIYPVSMSLTYDITGARSPGLLIVLSKADVGGSGYPAQYLFGGVAPFIRTAYGGIWGSWASAAVL